MWHTQRKLSDALETEPEEKYFLKPYQLERLLKRNSEFIGKRDIRNAKRRKQRKAAAVKAIMASKRRGASVYSVEGASRAIMERGGGSGCQTGLYATPSEKLDLMVDNDQGNRIYSTEGTSTTLCSDGGGYGGKTGLYATPSEEGGLDVVIQSGSQSARVYSPDGLSATLCSGLGGGGNKTGLYAVIDSGSIPYRVYHENGLSPSLLSCDHKRPKSVAVKEDAPKNGVAFELVRDREPSELSGLKLVTYGSVQNRVYSPEGLSPTLCGADYGMPKKVATKAEWLSQEQIDKMVDGSKRIIAPDDPGGNGPRAVREVGFHKTDPSTGRRIKKCEEPMWTIRTDAHHGVALEDKGSVGIKKVMGSSQHASVYDDAGLSPTLAACDDKDPTKVVVGGGNPKEGKGVLLIDGVAYNIRRLTPRECFRLQGFTDELFERAAAVNSDTQLYKQAGNAVTATVAYEIGRAILEMEENGDVQRVGRTVERGDCKVP